jgi:hypothetical protein
MMDAQDRASEVVDDSPKTLVGLTGFAVVLFDFWIERAHWIDDHQAGLHIAHESGEVPDHPGVVDIPED